METEEPRSSVRRGRPPEAPPDQVIACAMGLFWAKGYLDTTVEDLVDGAAGNRFSFYATQGGKRGLFLSAVGHTARRSLYP